MLRYKNQNDLRAIDYITSIISYQCQSVRCGNVYVGGGAEERRKENNRTEGANDGFVSAPVSCQHGVGVRVWGGGGVGGEEESEQHNGMMV